MNAHKFVAEHGIEEAKRVLDKYKDCYMPSVFKYWSEKMSDFVLAPKYASCKVSELKQVVESVEIVDQLGELNSVKKKLYGKHIGYTHFNVGVNGRWAFLDHYVDFIPDSAYHIGLINKHIADYELVESYKQEKCEVLDMVDVSPRCEVKNG